MGSKGVGMPQHAILNAWGSLVMDAFGGEESRPYLVGSATTTSQWRDVDVRVMLDDAEWQRLLPGVPPSSAAGFAHPRWAALCMAVSAWGKAFTGLPIDFQFQHVRDANERFKGIREPLGMRIAEKPPRPCPRCECCTVAEPAHRVNARLWDAPVATTNPTLEA